MPGPETGKSYVHFLDVSNADARQWLPLEGATLAEGIDASPPLNGFAVIAQQYLFDEFNDELVQARSNRGRLSLLTSLSRTATTNTTTQTNRNWRGLHVAIEVTVAAGTGIIPHIQGQADSGLFYDILVGTTITATGLVIIKVYPGIGVIAGGAASDILPFLWRFQMEATDASANTYEVNANLNI